MGKSVYEIITNKIIEKLEAGVVPWRKHLKNFSMKEKITKKSLPKTLNQSKAFLIFSLLFFRKERVFFT